MRAIILSNGELSSLAVLKSRLREWLEAGAHPLVIAADGGSRYAGLLDLSINVVVGDLDSLDDAERTSLQKNGVQFEKFPAHKDETDLELALLYAVEHRAKEIIVLGAMGGRLDMSLANILLLTHHNLRSADIRLWYGRQTAWLICPPGDSVTGQPGDTLSLIPLGGDALGVTTENLEYPLKTETLVFGPARGVSNVMTTPTARVHLEEGLLLAIYTPGRA